MLVCLNMAGFGAPEDLQMTEGETCGHPGSIWFEAGRSRILWPEIGRTRILWPMVYQDGRYDA